MYLMLCLFFFSSRRRHTRCALVTGVQTCALPIYWPRDTPVTLQSLANWMISVSDNSAADTLIHLLGRESIEARMVAAGHSTPSRNIPFLTTVEAFALKGNNFADQRAAFLAGDDAAQRRVIRSDKHTSERQ